jgi:hypothetical protein
MITLTREEAQQMLDALINAKGYIFYNVLDDKGNRYDAAADILRARLSAPEPEPVAWMFVNKFDGGEYIFKHSGEGLFNKDEFDIKPLYTAPPQRECASQVHDRREWQGLTDDEIIDTANNAPFDTMVSAEDYIYVIARAIEAKLREKNS